MVITDQTKNEWTGELSAIVDEQSPFSVDAQGWLRVAGRLDRERKAEHRVHIRLRDGRAPSKGRERTTRKTEGT